ncbi:LOW QUALITY PROTEIN: beclin-1 [Dermatophagoides farinae]|uniref:LOW QUALITY PROTEIN: beclin-1 n=1 Tax=Dermatophagoides farinae TaxID=6954 RepID=UPI003F61BED2
MENHQDKKPLSIDVNFSCQRCCQPLRLHQTLNNITKETFQDLISRNRDSSSSEDKTTGIRIDDDNPSGSNDGPKSNSHVIYKTIHSFRNKKLNDCDYSLINPVTDSNNGSLPSTLVTSTLLSGFDQSSNTHSKSSKDLKLQIQLFDILSDQSDIDHPLCEECADFVIEQMDKQLMILEQECNEFSEYKKKIEQDISSITTDEEVNNLQARLKELYQTQSDLIVELKDLNEQQQSLDKQLKQSKKELKQSEIATERYFQEYNALKFNYFQCEEEYRTLENKIRDAKEYFARLKRTSVFNLTFCIWHTGPFGTINGFRLGRLPNIQVEWQEINAAWGQCALLLVSLAKKLGFTFQRYKIVPYGNFSFIESLDDKSKQLPLYTAGGIKYYFHQKFDQAMVAFLDCLQEFYDEIRLQDRNFKLPYEMHSKGEIYEKTNNVRYSIKISINTEENWTKALKFMLTNLKWALAWVTTKHDN